MPFPYETSATPVRVRRSKDKDSRSTISSSTGKKQKRSGSSNRSPPQTDRSSQSSLCSQQNSTLDQLPALPESGTASPGSAASPVLRGPAVTATQATDAAFTAHHYTPAALQQYLQIEEDQPSSKTAPLPEEPQERPRRELADVKRLQAYSQPLDSETPTPLATSIREYPEQPHDRSSSPSFFSHPLQSRTSTFSGTSSSKTEENRSPTVSSPPPSSSSPSVSRIASVHASLPLEQPRPQSNLAYLPNSLAFPPSIPFNTPLATDQYPNAAYTAPQPYHMIQSAGHQLNLRPVAPQDIPLYGHYAVPPYVPGPFSPSNHMQNMGHSSTSSRASATGEPLPLLRTGPGPMETISSLDNTATLKRGEKDDGGELLQRIQSAIPDLHLLLDRFQETSGQLGQKENLIKEVEQQKLVALKKKEAYIEKLAKEIDEVRSKYSAESSKLRFEISNMEEKQKELRDTILAEQKSRDELQAKNQALSVELERARGNLEEEKLKIINEFELWKGKALEDKKMLEDNLQRVKQQAEKTLEGRLADLDRVHAQEKESLLANLARQKMEMEANHTQAQHKLEKAWDVEKKAHEEARRKYDEERSRWKKEHALLGKGSEEQKNILASQHQTEKEEMRKKYEASEARIRTQAQDEVSKMRSRQDKMKADWDAEKASFIKATADLKAQAARMDDENKKLQGLADAFGEVTGLRSRGDPFYQDAFKDLERQIIDLVVEHFQETPENLPDKASNLIPVDLAASFSTTQSSPWFIAAFIEHTISSIITQRIFEPFLFVLSGRLRSADALFLEMSRNLKSKSTRREASWRQRTLHAAYTAANAKQTINNIANDIIDEIMDAIRYFTDRAKWQHVTAAVRRIVKTAAETWRYARLESSVVVASMDGHEIANASNGRGEENVASQDKGKKVLLALFPLIKREALYGVSEEEFKPLDAGRIYSQGRVLYADDANRLTRIEELQGGQSGIQAVLSSKDMQASQKPQLTRSARPQSPLVPAELPPVMSPDDSRWNDGPGVEQRRSDQEQGLNSASASAKVPQSGTVPIDQEVARGSPTPSTRQSSIWTNASGQGTPSASRAASGKDLERPHRLASAVEN